MGSDCPCACAFFLGDGCVLKLIVVTVHNSGHAGSHSVVHLCLSKAVTDVVLR